MIEAAAAATATAIASAVVVTVDAATVAIPAAEPPLPYPFGICTPMMVMIAWGMHQLEKFWSAAELSVSDRSDHFHVLLFAARPIQRANYQNREGKLI